MKNQIATSQTKNSGILTRPSESLGSSQFSSSPLWSFPMAQSTLEETLKRISLSSSMTSELISDYDQNNKPTALNQPEPEVLRCSPDTTETPPLERSSPSSNGRHPSERSQLHPSLQQFTWARQLFAKAARLSDSGMEHPESILNAHLARVWHKRASDMIREDQRDEGHVGSASQWVVRHRNGRRRRPGIKSRESINRCTNLLDIGVEQKPEVKHTINRCPNIQQTVSACSSCTTTKQFSHRARFIPQPGIATHSMHNTERPFSKVGITPLVPTSRCFPCQMFNQYPSQHYHHYHHHHHHYYCHHHHHHHHHQHHHPPCENCLRRPTCALPGPCSAGFDPFTDTHELLWPTGFNKSVTADNSTKYFPRTTHENEMDITVASQMHEKVETWCINEQSGSSVSSVSMSPLSSSVSDETEYTKGFLFPAHTSQPLGRASTDHLTCSTRNASLDAFPSNQHNPTPGNCLNKELESAFPLHATFSRSKSLPEIFGSYSSTGAISKDKPSQSITIVLVITRTPGQPLPHITYWNGTTLTLGEYKKLLAKKQVILGNTENLKYFFKCASNEFYPGLVYQEVQDEQATVPLWDGIVWGNIEYGWSTNLFLPSGAKIHTET